MKYTYTTICLQNDSYPLKQSDLHSLNKHYEDGWEYVDSITQHCSVAKGDGYGAKSVYGSVLVTLRKEIVEL